MRLHEKLNLIGLSLALLLGLAMVLTRPVGAEDDCAEGTWKVERVPVLGLLCIGEGWRS
jgi:hypothetical protein